VIDVRALTPADWQIWRELRLAALAEAPTAFGSRLADWQDAGQERWRDRLAIPGSVNFIALLERKPAGMASGIPGENGIPVLISMWVSPAGRGRGIGDRLVQAVAQWACSQGAAALRLAVAEDNQHAAALYRRNGFTDTGELANPLPPGNRTVKVMMKQLGLVTPPPVARVDVVREERFGIGLADPYRWMEDAGGEEMRGWLSGQATYATSVLAGLPGRDALLARVTELTAGAARRSAFKLAGDRLFFQQGAVLMVDDGQAGRVLLDPAALPGPEHSSLDWFVPSPDGRLVACGISQGGSEWSTLRVIDAGSGELRQDAVPGTFHGAVSWVPGDDAFVCHRYLAPPPGTPPRQRRLGSRACLHRLGARAADDLVVLARGLSPLVEMAPVDRPFVLTPSGSDWMIAIISHSALTGPVGEQMSDSSLYVAPRAGLADPPACPWQRVAGPADGVTSLAVDGGDLYLVTYCGAPRSRVVKVPLAAPDLAAATVVLPGGERAVVAIRVMGDQLLVHEREAGISRLRQVPLAGGTPRDVPLPADGAITHWTAHADRPEAFITINSWTRSSRVYRYDGESGAVTDTGWAPPAAADFSDIITSGLRAPARDGTLIPLRVVHRKGLALDGANPAILSGYGCFGYVPSGLFAPAMLAWYERGGVYAYAGLRGGGEFGREWHQAGLGPLKENTITDFIDCAEYLIRNGYTSPERLAGEGTSGGGIPAGGALVRRPDLWAAMIMQVPLTNSTRFEFSENGPVNVPEMGSVSTESGLRDLLITDSYLRVRDGVRYPAVLLTAGLNDPRLPVWQPAKMAARLQAATASGRPVLLRVDPHAGHGRGSTRAQRNELTADILAFLMQELTPPRARSDALRR
jgi:prolyl oligopeptidase